MNSPSTLPNRRGRRGFALPSAIFALVVVALLVTAGFYMSGQESRIGQSVERTTAARLLAESGLNETAAIWRPSDVGGLDVGQVVALPAVAQGEGEWAVRVTRVDSTLYMAESTGRITQAGRLSGASRTLFQMLRVPPLNIANPPGALTTQGTLQVGGNAQIDGNNSNGPTNWSSHAMCGPADPAGSKPGVVLNDGGSAVRNNGQPVRTADQLGNNIEVAGTAPHVQKNDQLVQNSMAVFEDDSWNVLVAMAQVRIARGNVSGYKQVANGNLNPGPSLDGTACDYSDHLNWGALENVTHACSSYRPIIHLTGGSFEIQAGSSGQGTLLVDGDLWLRGAFNWAGLILVKGTIRTSGGGGGDPQVLGAVVARNSELDAQSLTGNSLIRYSSCSVQLALEGARANLPLRPLSRRNWVDATAAGF